MHLTSSLAQSPLFTIRSETLSWSERVRLSYDRAREVVKVYNLTADEILQVSERFWQFHADPILTMHGSVGTLLTIHYNLCIGTLAMFARGDRTLRARSTNYYGSNCGDGQFCLTELGHGLDAINGETTATLLSDGSIELNTPNEMAAKYMPPTTPCGIACVAVVFARLIVQGENRGIKPFLVPIHDGAEVCEGIISRPLTPRGGAEPIAHALTYFHHVRLPGSALLGEATKAPKLEFFFNISRVIVGTLSMGALGVSNMRLASFIAGKYSQRRAVIDAATGSPRAIISFSTQYLPILTATAQTYVFQSFAQSSLGCGL